MFLFCDLAGSYTGEMSQNLSNVQKKTEKDEDENRGGVGSELHECDITEVGYIETM